MNKKRFRVTLEVMYIHTNDCSYGLIEITVKAIDCLDAQMIAFERVEQSYDCTVVEILGVSEVDS